MSSTRLPGRRGRDGVLLPLTFWFSRIELEASYWLHLAPAMFVLAVGFGLGVIALTKPAVYRVDADKAGIASALLNSAQQIGVALGIAVLAGVADTTVTSGPEYVDVSTGAALVAGYSSALTVAVGLLVAAAAVAFAILGSAESASAPDSARSRALRLGCRERPRERAYGL